MCYINGILIVKDIFESKIHTNEAISRCFSEATFVLLMAIRLQAYIATPNTLSELLAILKFSRLSDYLNVGIVLSWMCEF